METGNLLETINEVIVLPISIATFFILIYIVIYLWKKNPDVIRSRIFLNFRKFENAFLLLAVFAFVLVFHIVLIYEPHFFYFILNCSPLLAYDLQKFFGLLLSVIMMAFTYSIYRSIK